MESKFVGRVGNSIESIPDNFYVTCVTSELVFRLINILECVFRGVYLVISVGLLQFSLHRLAQIQISVKLSNPSLESICPPFPCPRSP